MPTLTVRTDQRVGAVGRTRSGKTFAMERLLAGQPNVCVIDSKHRVQWPGYHLTYDRGAALIEPKTIWRHEGPVAPGFWKDARSALHDRGGGVLYIDELPVLTGPNRIDPELANTFRLGGELGVGVWWAAQESTGVHNTAIRQTDIMLLFVNQGASDRDKIIRTCGDIGEATAYLAPWQFLVFENFGQTYDPRDIPVWQVAQ